MDKKQILVVCTHHAILQTIIRLINQEAGWQGIPAESAAAARHIMSIKPVDLLLLGAGLHTAEENGLMKQRGQVPCVKHYGGGSGLLFSEVQQALKSV